MFVFGRDLLWDGALPTESPVQRLVSMSMILTFMSGSSHILSVLIGVEYQNCLQTLDGYLLFATPQG